MYERYGRDRAAQVANVITYRARSAVRDMGKALGYATGQLDAWSKQIDAWGRGRSHRRAGRPRHPSPLSWPWPRRSRTSPATSASTPGGMVICDRPDRRGVPGRVGPDGGPHRPAVGQGRLRRRRAGQVRPARARDARASCTTPSTSSGRRREVDRPGDHPPGPGRLRHAVPGRLGRGVPGREPGPDGHPAPAAATELLRPGRRGGAHPPGADPGRARSIPTSAGATGQEDGHLPASVAASGRWRRRSGCRCSRSS